MPSKPTACAKRSCRRRIRRIDGLLFSGDGAAREALQALVDASVPVVIYNNDIPNLQVDKVLVRDRLGTQEAVREMIALGHERIGIATGDLETQTALNRLDGYRDAFEDAGLRYDPALVFEGAWSRETGRDATRMFLAGERPPSAIFYSSDRIGRGGLDHLNHAGLTAGCDVDMVSFDDHEVFRMIKPGISAVAQPVVEIAAHVADLMASRLDGEAPEEGRTVELDCSFIRRGSLNRRTKARHMKIVTYNIRYGVGKDDKLDLGRIAGELKGADIIGLQEVDRFWKRSGELDQAEDAEPRCSVTITGSTLPA